MPIGRMRERVSLQEEQQTPDGAGGYSVAWVDVHSNIPARVRPLSTREQLQAAQMEAQVDYEVTIRSRSNVRADQRLVWGAVVMNVRGVMNPDEKDRYLALTCEAGVAT